MSCEMVIGSMVALLDGELAGVERRAVEEHVAGCAACQGELQGLQATRALVSQSLRASDRVDARPSFEDLWSRIELDEPVPSRSRVRAGLRRGVPSPRVPRRRALWAGAGGLALAASLALLIVGLPRDRASEVPPAPARLAAKPPAVAGRTEAKSETRVAAAPKPKPKPKPAPVAEESDSAAGQEGDTPPEGGESTVVVNEIDPPRELLERPDLFLNYPIVRKLDELQQMESVLADSPDGGSAG